MSEKIIDVEPVQDKPQTQAVAIRETGGALSYALSIDELHRQLEFVRDVMRREMREGQDYGKIPGTGEKPTLLQPGAQKLLMTFNLSEQVEKEVLREFANWHREYEFTIAVRAANGKVWHGVGTCSTLESKYRYRKAAIRCPKCGKSTVIAGKQEYGGGWLCWAKKGGCGEKFAYSDPRIANQPTGDVENPDIADCWNTVRKMAFKRALVAASINATNTSELWTQDLEEGQEPAEASAPKPKAPAGKSIEKGAATSQPAQTNAPAAAQEKKPTRWKRSVTTLNYVLQEIKARPGEANRAIATEYFRKVGPPSALLPNEEVEELPLRFCPNTPEQLAALVNCIANFEAGGDAVLAFEIEGEEPPKSSGGSPSQNTTQTTTPPTQTTPTTSGSKQSAVPSGTTNTMPAPGINKKDPEWWREIIVPIPPKGMKKADYMRHPQTLGMLFELRHGNDEEAQSARQRMWGFVNNYQPKPWKKQNGQEVPPSPADFLFREALDAFHDWFEREHPDEQL